mmetsp:Transcript_29260/g.94296  ORF Transcript_29260/g.94296 Transcript_29260/m.94296 type:complete len:208 (-) Transcript_29260:658-1281(-)|eukprot:scaffold28784_cov112-Isochrysis_galbana.AAC.4
MQHLRAREHVERKDEIRVRARVDEWQIRLRAIHPDPQTRGCPPTVRGPLARASPPRVTQPGEQWRLEPMQRLEQSARLRSVKSIGYGWGGEAGPHVERVALAGLRIEALAPEALAEGRNAQSRVADRRGRQRQQQGQRAPLPRPRSDSAQDETLQAQVESVPCQKGDGNGSGQAPREVQVHQRCSGTAAQRGGAQLLWPARADREGP